MRPIAPGWCRSDNMVQDAEQVIQVADLAMAGRIVLIRLLLRDLLKHRSEKHVEPGIILDHRLQFLDHWSELSGILIDVLNDISKPFPLDAVVCGQPSTCPEGVLTCFPASHIV